MFLARPPILLLYSSTAASSSRLSAKSSVLQMGSTGAYRHFQRFALEAPVPQIFKHKGGACQYFSGFSDFGQKSDPFSFSHGVFSLAKSLLSEATRLEQLHLSQEVRNTVSVKLPKCSRLSAV